MAKKENPFEAQTYSEKINSGYLLASSLIAQDWRFILFQIPLFMLPALLLTMAPQTIQARLGVDLSFRLVTVLIIFLIIRRWLTRLDTAQSKRKPTSFLALCIAGIAYHLLLVGPLALLSLSPGQLSMVALALSVPCFYFALRYYFYFIPIMLGELTPSTVLKNSATLTKKSLWLPIQIMVTPFGLALLISKLIMAFSPDQSSPTLSLLAETSYGIFYIFSTYLALSMALVLMTEKQWSDAGLDPYRGSRLNTLLMLGGDGLARYLKPRSGLLILAVALLVWSGNSMRASTLPPPVSIEIISSRAVDHQIELELYAYDIGNGLRAFYPALLNIAGESGSPLSLRPEQIEVDGEEIPLFASPSSSLNSPVHIKLVFATERSEQELKSMQGVFLWYRQYKVQEIMTLE